MIRSSKSSHPPSALRASYNGRKAAAKPVSAAVLRADCRVNRPSRAASTRNINSFSLGSASPSIPRRSLVGNASILAPNGALALSPYRNTPSSRSRVSASSLSKVNPDNLPWAFRSLPDPCARTSSNSPNQPSTPSITPATRSRSAAAKSITPKSSLTLRKSDRFPTNCSINPMKSLPENSRATSATAPAASPFAISSRISCRNNRAERSSSSPNRGETPASSGNRRKSVAQKLWIVCIRKPPGASMARANSRRARARWSLSIRFSPRSASACCNAASGFIAHSPRVLNSRFCISLAADLV